MIAEVNYPNPDAVERATLAQLRIWRALLPLTVTDQEHETMARIIERIEEAEADDGS